MLVTRVATDARPVPVRRGSAAIPAPPSYTPDRAVPADGVRLLSETEIGARILRRLDAARARRAPDTMAALRAAVTDLADRMRELGLPYERTAAALESMLREHGVARPVPTLDADDDAAAREDAVLRQRLFDWCARAYHGDGWW